VRPCTRAATTAATCEKLLAATKTELQKRTARVEALGEQVHQVTDQLAVFAEAAGEREERLEQEKDRLEKVVQVQEQKHRRKRGLEERRRERERGKTQKQCSRLTHQLGAGELPLAPPPPTPPVRVYMQCHSINLPLLHVLASSWGANEEGREV
jgi:hypothetical protein